MRKIPEGFTIGALADAAAVGVETIRFYQRKGLMAKPDRPLGGIRRYTAQALARVRFIKRARGLGFSLGEIDELLKLEDGTRCEDARGLAERKLVEVRQRVADLQRVEVALGELVACCGAVRGLARCPLIAALHR
jgi:MerR family mercuric resistance operon transcriptional regulator